MPDPIFTEVIDVELNSGPLEASLTALISMYQGKLQELSSSGLDASSFGGLNISAITDDLESVRTELKSLTDAFMESFGAIAAASASASTETTTNVTRALQETDAAVSASTKTQLENLSLLASGSEEAWGTFAQAAQKALSDDFDPRVRMTADLTNNLYSLIMEGGREAFGELTAQQQDWFLGFQSALAKVEDAVKLTTAEGTEAWQLEQQKQIAIVENATKMMEADFKKRADSSAFYVAGSDEFQLAQMKEVATVEEATRLMEADFKKREAAANSVTTVGTDAWQQAQMREVAIVEQATALMEADFKKRAAASNFYEAGSDEFQIAQMKEVAVVEEATRLMEADFAKRAAAAKAAAAGEAAANQSFLSSALESHLASQVSSLATLMVEWAAIGEVINLASKSVDAFFGFFKTGLTYMEELETRTAALQGVLASNVKFSADTTENFILAGTAAASINKQIQDYSIKYGVAIDVLTRGFKSFVESGGVVLVHGVDEALQASTLLSVAIKASGKDAETTRAALSEIPKLLDGTITSTSKILETLGVSTQEWKNMLSEAKSQEDLLDQLKTKLAAYSQVAQDSADRVGAIKQELGLAYDRVAALAAQQFWDTLKDDLKTIRDFLAENKTQIDAVAVALGQMANQAISITNVQTALHGVLTGVTELSVGLIHIEYDIKGVIQGFTLLTKALGLFEDLASIPIKGNVSQYKQRLTDDLAGIIALWKQSVADIDIEKQQIDALRNPKPEPAAPSTPANDGGKAPPDNTKATSDAIKALKIQYQELFEANKLAGDKEKEQIAENLAARKISVDTASQLTIAADNKEYESQLRLIDLYKQKSAAVKAPAASKTSFIGSLDKQEGSLNDANTKAISAQAQKEITDQLKVQDQALSQYEAALKKDAAEQISVIQARVKAGTELVSQSLQEELAITTATHEKIKVVLVAEYAQAGANAALKQAAVAKMTAEDAAYTAAVKNNAEARKSALLAELQSANKVLVDQAKEQYAALVSESEARTRNTATKLDGLNTTLSLAKAYLSLNQEITAAAAAELFYGRAGGATGKELAALIKQYTDAKAALDKAQGAVNKDAKAVVANDPIVPALQEALGDWKDLFQDFATDNKSFTEDLRGFGTDLAQTMTSTTATMNAVIKTMTSMEAAIEKGGAQGVSAGLGAAGSGLSSISADVGNAVKSGGSLVSSLSSSMQGLFANAGVVGSLMSAASGLISVISSLFTASAQRIANNIESAFKTTMAAYNNGEATLQATLAAVQADRASAIAQLSGKKGGQEQLDKILPGLDAEIAQLEQQQKTIITNFETSLQKLQLHSTVLSQTLDTWNSINASVKAYIDAGGDAAKAAAYLSESLYALKTDAANNLAQGDKDAITQALNYNALLVQRQQLTDAYNKSRFDTLNADALERRASNAVSVGLTQKTADATYQSSLTDLNSQISLAASEVSMYKQIYQISSDTATLKAQSNALDLAALAQQIQTLKDYQTVYNSIFKNTDGTYGTSNGAGTGQTGTGNTNPYNVGISGPIQLTVNVNGANGVDPYAIAGTIQNELQKAGRYGVGSTFSTN